MRATLRWLALGAASTAAVYAATVALARARYGAVRLPCSRDHDELLDRFMPSYDVVERHRIRVRAPAETTFAAACEVDLGDSPVAAALFKAREMMLGERPQESTPRSGLLAGMKEIGWRVLAEEPGREIEFGAVTKPWVAKPVFRGVTPDDFHRFEEPGYVKIAWTIRADPAGPHESIARTETRAATTDAAARSAFRRYWSYVAPGVVLLRFALLRRIRRDAERRAANPNLNLNLHANPELRT